MDFSVNSLHSIEKKMKSEIARLLKATNVSSVADWNQKVLSDKLNKGPLSEYLSSFVKLLDSSLDLCKGAAGSIDEMKTKVMDTQSQLIDRKKEELGTVSETVKTELKSWVDIVKKDNKQNRQLTTKSVKEAVKIVNQEEERSRNLIIYGVKEPAEDSWENSLKFDLATDTVKSITEITDTSNIDIIHSCRVGDKKPGKIRPIKVKLESSLHVESILKNAHKLKTNNDFKTVFLAPDRTPEQRAAHSKLVIQMKEMIKNDSSKHYFIKDDKVKFTDKK